MLAVVGDVDADEVFAKAEQYFGAIPRKADPSRPKVNKLLSANRMPELNSQEE